MPPPVKTLPPFKKPASVFMGGLSLSGMNFTWRLLKANFACPTFFSQIGKRVPWVRMTVASSRQDSKMFEGVASGDQCRLYLFANWACLYVTCRKKSTVSIVPLGHVHNDNVTYVHRSTIFSWFAEDNCTSAQLLWECLRVGLKR